MKTTIITISLLVASLFSANAATVNHITNSARLAHKKTEKTVTQKQNSRPVVMHEQRIKKGNHCVADPVMWNRF